MISEIIDNRMYVQFDSIAEFTSISSHDIEHKPYNGNSGHGGQRKDSDISFYGKTTYKGIISALINGVNDSELIERADALLDKIEASEPETQGHMYSRDVFGSRLNVGEYGAGLPTCMRRRKVVTNEAMPVKVYVCFNSGGGCSPESFLNRGVAIIALVRKLAQSRPVELVGFITGKLNGRSGAASMVAKINVNTRPIDLATMLPCLTDVSTDRRLGMGFQDCLGYKGDAITYDVVETSQILGLSANDIIVGRLNYKDRWNDPVSWVNNQLLLVKSRLTQE